MNDITPLELLQSLELKDTILFIGAGLSMGSGLPGWIDLTRPLSQRMGSRWPASEIDLTAGHMLNIVQYYENQHGRHTLLNYLRQSLDTTGYDPTQVHHLVVSLPINTIFTTNYDDLIERTLQQANKHFHIVVEESELAFWREIDIQVVKLCGDLTRPSSIVITQRDFNTYFSTHPRITARLRTMLESKIALFLGYSLQDPFFNQVWDNIGLDFGSLRRRGYAVLFDAEPLDIDDLERRNIHVINLTTQNQNKTEVLEEWLTTLSKSLSFSQSLTEAEKKGEGSSKPAPIHSNGDSWAILIGVNQYDDKINYGNLQVCVRDVEAIRDQLITGGFDPDRIRLLTDQTEELPTRDNILVAFKSIADATEPDDLLLFYYSGHGDEDNGESYLTTRNGRRLVLQDTAIPISRIKEIMEQAPAYAKILILDSCHSGANIGGKGPQPMSAEFIRRVFEQAEGMAIMASCKQGQLSYEWRTQERSVFTHFLLEAISGQADQDNKGFVTVQDANRYVVNGVKLWASKRSVSQTPTLQYSVAGDIILCDYAQRPSVL
jgi:hypothetical protein